MKPGEVLRQVQDTALSVITSLRRALSNNRYGTPEERLEGYRALYETFTWAFETYPGRVGKARSDYTTRRMVADLTGIGRGTLDEKDGVFTFHIASYQSAPIPSAWGEKRRQRHSIVRLVPESAVVEEWTEIRITPPTDHPFPVVRDSRHRHCPLSAQEAQDLAVFVASPGFVPVIDAWFTEYPGRELT